MAPHKKSKKSVKTEKEKSDKNKPSNSRKDPIPKTNSKEEGSLKPTRHGKKESVSTKSAVKPNCTSVNRSGKMSDPDSKMVDNKINKCDPGDGSKNSLNNLGNSIKMNEKNGENKGLKNTNRSIKSVSDDKKTQMKVRPENANKRKTITCTTTTDNLSAVDDSDIVKVKSRKPRKLSLSDAFDDGSNFERNPKVDGKSEKKCINKGTENKNLNLATGSSLAQDVSNSVENKHSTSNKVTAYSTQQTPQGSEEEKPIKPESFLPKETMRIKRKKVKAAPIKKRRNTICFPHICADDDEDLKVFLPSPKVNAEIEAHEDGEISSSSSEFSDGYDENLMGDESDRERLSKLCEVDREFELYKRGEEREIKKRHWEIIRKIKKNRIIEANKLTETSGRCLKRKEELEKVNAKNERSTAMAALVKEREKKYNHALENCANDDKSIPEEENEILPHVAKRRKSTVKLKASDIYSDESCSEDENIVEIKPSTPVMIHNIKTVQELNQMFISRSTLEKILYLPFFEKTVLNSFVRVKGSSSFLQNNYFVGEVVSILIRDNVYTLGNTISNIYLKLKNVTKLLIVPMAYMSNEYFKEPEFERWMTDCEANNMTLPKLEDMKNKMKEITEALKYNVTDDDINKMVELKTALRQYPQNKVYEEDCLSKDRNSATHNGDTDHVVFLNQKIKEILNGNNNRIMQRRQTMHTSTPFRRTALPDLSLDRQETVNPYDPYTRRPTRPHKVVTSVGNKENDNNT